MDHHPWVIIGLGKSGWHAKASGCSSSSHDRSEKQLLAYAAEAAEECFVYDASQADYDLFAEFVIAGPMVDPDLPAGTIDRLSTSSRSAMASMLPGLGGGFASLAAAVLAQPKLRSLDRVSIDIYEALLRKIPNVCMGRVRSGKVEWE